MNATAFEIESGTTPGLPLRENLYLRLTTTPGPLTYEQLAEKLKSADARAKATITAKAIRAQLESCGVTIRRATAVLADHQHRQKLAQEVTLRQMNAFLIRNTRLAYKKSNIHRYYAHMHDRLVFRAVQERVARREYGECLQKKLAAAAARRAQLLKDRVTRRITAEPIKSIYEFLEPVIETSSFSSIASISSMA